VSYGDVLVDFPDLILWWGHAITGVMTLEQALQPLAGGPIQEKET
jgi:hypothetical protein